MKFKGFQLDKLYSVKTSFYKSYSTILEDQLIFFERYDDIAKGERRIDCFASHWIVGVAGDVPSGVSLRSGESYIEVKSHDIIFLPAFTILEWAFDVTALIKWTGYISPNPLPKNVPLKPFLFRGESERFFRDSNEIFCFLKEAQETSKVVAIDEQRKSSTVAMAIKNSIQNEYDSSEGLHVLCKKMNISRMTFSSSFKKAYGLTPIQYLHRLRIFESLRLINQGYSVTDALFAVGFSDPGQYIDHFKSLFSINPKNFVPKNSEIPKGEGNKLDSLSLQNSK